MGGGPGTPPSVGCLTEAFEEDNQLYQSFDDSHSMLSEDLVEVTRPLTNVLTPDPPLQTSTVQDQSESLVHLPEPDQTLEQTDQTQLEPYKLRWSKSKVYIHPSNFLRDNIPGYLGILQRAPRSFYLSWIPENAINESPDRECWVKLELDPEFVTEETLVNVPPEAQATPLHAFSVPINSIHSLIMSPPTLSSWHGKVLINLFCGPTLPALYFHDDESRSTHFARETRQARLATGQLSALPASWGGEALLTQLHRFADVCPSTRERGLYLLNPSRAEREEHLTPVYADDALLVPNSLPQRNSILHESLNGGKHPASMDEFTFSLLSSFSRITQNAKSAAQMVLSHRLAKPIIPHLPQPIASLANGEPEFIRWSQQAGVEGYDVARVYLAKWASIVAAQGERSRRAEFNDWDLEPSADEDSLNTLGGGFEVIHATYQVPKMYSKRAPSQPVELEEFLAWQDDSGRLMLDETEGRRRIFQRGVAPGARKEVWLFLLGVYEWKSDSIERQSKRESMDETYAKLKESWEAEDAEIRSTTLFQEESHRIEIDCRRTDRTQPYFSVPKVRTTGDDGDEQADDSNMPSTNSHVQTVGKILMTYNVWEKDLGYVQGMSDLCAPLYVVFEADEVLTFFGFVKLMDKMKSHFLRDQSGMKDELSRLQQLLLLIDPQLYRHFEKTNSLNLFFCFRWILISFKREFEFNDVLKVWEALWTDVCGPHSDLFLALAILESHREPIIRYLQEFDEVLKYVNDIANTLDCDSLLGQAEVLYLTFKSIIETRSTSTQDGLQVIQNGKRTVAVTEELGSLL